MTDPNPHPDTDPDGAVVSSGEGLTPSREPVGSGEAARYRRRLRDAEGQRDALAAWLETAPRREVERLAGRGLADGADLWRGEGIDLPGLLDDDGNVSAERVQGAVACVLAAHPHWGPRTASADPHQGRKTERQAAPTFAEFLPGAGE